MVNSVDSGGEIVGSYPPILLITVRNVGFSVGTSRSMSCTMHIYTSEGMPSPHSDGFGSSLTESDPFYTV